MHQVMEEPLGTSQVGATSPEPFELWSLEGRGSYEDRVVLSAKLPTDTYLSCIESRKGEKNSEGATASNAGRHSGQDTLGRRQGHSSGSSGGQDHNRALGRCQGASFAQQRADRDAGRNGTAEPGMRQERTRCEHGAPRLPGRAVRMSKGTGGLQSVMTHKNCG